MRILVFISCLLMLTTDGIAQTQHGAHLIGIVRDSITGRPIENVNVFLSSTTFGVGTDRNGSYSLSGLPFGRFNLVFSRVGYAVEVLPVDLVRPDTTIRDVFLAQRLIILNDVEVSSDAAREWHRNFEYFASHFLGGGTNARQCEIKNPDVLSFKFDLQTGLLQASASNPVLVTNRALGYQLEVSIAEFHWDTRQDFGYFLVYPLFRELTASSQAESRTWQDNRRRTYQGSFQHFLRAVVQGTLDAEGFAVYQGDLDALQHGRGKFKFPEEIQLQPVVASSLVRWTFDSWLRIERKGESRLQASYVTLDGSEALIDPIGVLADPLSIRLIGRWSKDRVSDMLPLHFEGFTKVPSSHGVPGGID